MTEYIVEFHYKVDAPRRVDAERYARNKGELVDTKVRRCSSEK